MKLENAAPVNAAVEEMLAADERASAQEDSPTNIHPCPLAPKREDAKPKPVRILMWNITELGGGFWMPPRRLDYCIDAYAAVIHAMKPDVCVLLGLQKGPPFGYTRVSSHKLGYAWHAKPGTENHGIMEANAILAGLEKLDVGIGWKAAFPVSDDGSYACVRGGTACVFYATGHGIALDRLDIVDGPVADSLGIPERLLAARLHMPLGKDQSAAPLGIVAPLVVLPEAERRSSAPPDATPLPKATGRLPDPSVVALSSELDLAVHRARLDDYCSSLDVEYPSLPDRGSVVTTSHWERIAYRGAGLVDNLLAVHPADVRLGDRRMHWEALPLPAHADEYGEVVGRIADLLLLRKQAGQPLALRKLQIVDLLRAALGPADLTRLHAQAGAQPEDGVLVAMRKRHFAATARPTMTGADDDPANVVAGCIEFLRLLSNHWPVCAELSTET
jgi:hypothetical protein